MRLLRLLLLRLLRLRRLHLRCLLLLLLILLLCLLCLLLLLLILLIRLLLLLLLLLLLQCVLLLRLHMALHSRGRRALTRGTVALLVLLHLPVDAMKLHDDLAHRRALGRIVLPAALHQRSQNVERRGQRDLRPLALDGDGEGGLEERLSAERNLHMHDLPEQHAIREDVALLVVALVRDHLGRHRAVGARLGRVLGAEVGRDAKVAH